MAQTKTRSKVAAKNNGASWDNAYAPNGHKDHGDYAAAQEQPKTNAPSEDKDTRIRKLQEQLRVMEQDKAELEQKRYVDASLHKFSDVMRIGVDTTLYDWSNALLEALVPYAGGLQGAIYMLETSTEADAPDTTTNGRDPSSNHFELHSASGKGDANQAHQYLRRVGGYALPAHALGVLRVGEGLTGQVAKTAEPLYFDDPAHFSAHTESGLTEIPAQVLLLLPLVHNEEVVGVLELTATQAFGQAQREFLDRFCEHAAANLQTLRNQEYIR